VQRRGTCAVGHRARKTHAQRVRKPYLSDLDPRDGTHGVHLERDGAASCQSAEGRGNALSEFTSRSLACKCCWFFQPRNNHTHHDKLGNGRGSGSQARVAAAENNNGKGASTIWGGQPQPPPAHTRHRVAPTFELRVGNFEIGTQKKASCRVCWVGNGMR